MLRVSQGRKKKAKRKGKRDTKEGKTWLQRHGGKKTAKSTKANENMPGICISQETNGAQKQRLFFSVPSNSAKRKMFSCFRPCGSGGQTPWSRILFDGSLSAFYLFLLFLEWVRLGGQINTKKIGSKANSHCCNTSCKSWIVCQIKIFLGKLSISAKYCFGHDYDFSLNCRTRMLWLS